MSEATLADEPQEVPETASAVETPEVKDAGKIWQLALRDIAIASAALSIWAAADTWYAVTQLGFAAVLGTINGLLIGAAFCALVHEWGHFVGARASGGVAPTTSLGSFLPLFNFDFAVNEESHFQAMSVGGNLGHWLAATLLFVALPIDTPARVALIAGAVGFCVFASTTEFPVISRVREGQKPLASLVQVRDTLGRNAWIGVGVAVVLVAVL